MDFTRRALLGIMRRTLTTAAARSRRSRRLVDARLQNMNELVRLIEECWCAKAENRHGMLRIKKDLMAMHNRWLACSSSNLPTSSTSKLFVSFSESSSGYKHV